MKMNTEYKEVHPKRRREYDQKRKFRRGARQAALCKRQAWTGSYTPVNKKDKGDPPTCLTSNLYGSLGSEDDGVCAKRMSLRGKARAVQVLLREELGLVPERELPDSISCGELRQAVRSTYPRDLPVLQELSIKTSMKLEHNLCRLCKEGFGEFIDKWKEARFQEFSDTPDTTEFTRAFTGNVPKGWNLRKYPYIPNGHATLSATRKEGGNWSAEEFSALCRLELVVSSGKPRVVSLFSEYNSRVLTPLHQSLFGLLRRKGWLLVGEPTDECVGNLNGGGDYASFDYIGATDNIRTVYVRAAIDALITQAEGMSEDEVRCLRVLGELRFKDDPDRVASIGQPMGSVMSFPLLCLINKTIVDLSLTQLLTEGKISFKEWTSHRCLINGDDLLTKEPRPATSMLFSAVSSQSERIGMKVNKEKSMLSSELGEINSTVFTKGSREKKTNVGALYMRPEVDDVIGFALSATATKEGFRRVVRANANILAKQSRKRLDQLPYPLVALCRKDKKIHRALLSAPESLRPPTTNFFPLVERPSGYSLTVSEEVDSINERVSLVRDRAIAAAAKVVKFRTRPIREAHSFNSVLKREPRREEDLILSCLARTWEANKKRHLVEEDRMTTCPVEPLFLGSEYGGQSKGFALVDSIKCWKQQRKSLRPQYVGTVFSPESIGNDWISLDV